jgi:hypothetical protein
VATTPADARAALQAAAWRRRTGFESPEALVDRAVEALVAGLDSPALAELAGADPREAREVHDLFVEALGEQGLDWPDEPTALWHLARLTAQQIVDGELDPGAGARWLWWHAAHDLEPEGDLRVFIALASDLDDHPGLRDELHEEIVRAAADLLSRDRMRRWLCVRADAEHPLTLRTTGGTDPPVDPDDLPVPPTTRAQVAAWSHRWREVLAGGGFASPAAAERFVAEGADLVEALRQTLGPGWQVEYHPEPTRPPGVRLRMT